MADLITFAILFFVLALVANGSGRKGHSRNFHGNSQMANNSLHNSGSAFSPSELSVIHLGDF